MDRLYKSSDRYKFIESLKSSDGYYIVCFDIINFKSINDKFGFYNGDRLLSQIVEYIDSLSNYNLEINVCRYECDIIMAMFKSNCEIDVFEFIDKITKYNYKYNINFRVGYKKVNTTIKLEHFLESIIYVIKDKKYTLNRKLDQSFKLNNDIEKYVAIKHDIMTNDSRNFKLLYQPKISNRGKHINSCEVLSRWNNLKIGKLYPNEFLPIIKNLNKEVEFDLMIFEKACDELSENYEIINRFSINVSIKSILSKKFVTDIYQLIGKYSISANNITLEIIEDICNYDHLEIPKNINELVELGFSISIDDFGTGYSSYSRLSELNFSEVKIPREFLILESISTDKKNKKILSGIVSMCKALNCDIVIEGVETKENVKLAEMLNIDYIQGYYYSKPLIKEEYINFINEYESKIFEKNIGSI